MPDGRGANGPATGTAAPVATAGGATGNFGRPARGAEPRQKRVGAPGRRGKGREQEQHQLNERSARRDYLQARPEN